MSGSRLFNGGCQARDALNLALRMASDFQRNVNAASVSKYLFIGNKACKRQSNIAPPGNDAL